MEKGKSREETGKLGRGWEGEGSGGEGVSSKNTAKYYSMPQSVSFLTYYMIYV